MKRINPQIRAEIEQEYGHLLGEFNGRVPEPESELDFNRCIQILQTAMSEGQVTQGDDPALRLQEAVFNSEEASVLAGESEEARRKEAAREASNKLLGGSDEHGRYPISRGKIQGIGLALGVALLIGGGYAFLSSSKLPTTVETAEGAIPEAPTGAGVADGVDSANIDDVQDPESVFAEEPGALEGEDTQDGVVGVAGSETEPVTAIEMSETQTVEAPPVSQTVTPVSSPVYVDPVVQPQAAVPVGVVSDGSAADPVVVRQSPQSQSEPLSPVAVTPVPAAPVVLSPAPLAGVGPSAPADSAPVVLAGGSERPQPVVLASGGDEALNVSAGSGASPLPGVVGAETVPTAQPETTPQAEGASAAPARPTAQVYRREAAAQTEAAQAPRSAVVYRQARTPTTGRVYGTAGGAASRPAAAQASTGAQGSTMVSTASVAAPGSSSRAPAASTGAADTQTSSGSLDNQINSLFGEGPATTPSAAAPAGQTSAPAASPAAAPVAPAAAPSAATSVTRTAGGGVIYRDVASARSSAPLSRTVYSSRQPAAQEAGAAAAAKPSNPYGAGSVVKAALVLKIIVAEGGESFVVAKLDSGENVIGTAKLGGGRVEMNFTRLITSAGEVGIQARGVGSDGALGVLATVLPKNPTLLQDLARSAFSGASNYFNQFTRTSTSTTFTPGGLPLVTNSAPAINLSLKDSVLSSLAGAVRLPNTEGLKFVNVAEVAVNTPLQVVFF